VLRHFAVWASIDDTEVPPGGGILCAKYTAPPWHMGDSHVTCTQPPMPARYVSLTAPGDNMRLVVCEVQVLGQRAYSIRHAFLTFDVLDGFT